MGQQASFLALLLFLVTICDVTKAENRTRCSILPKEKSDVPSLPPVLEKYETALLMLLGFGGFSVLLAVMYKLLRKYVFHDADNLDTTFDAGGNVSMSLTAVTVASQLLWPADLLQSSTVTVRSGIAAPLWYTVGIVVNMILFPVLSVKFKSIAPGAKTYVQLFYARFGKVTHAWYCFLALLVNLVIFICLIVTVRATMQALTKDASFEFCCLISAVLFGSYSFIGGLGTTFYVSYFNAVLLTVILMVIILHIMFSSTFHHLGLGDMRSMYDVVACLRGPTDNHERSLVTFRSFDSFIWGMIGLCQSAAVTFCDQASWQSRIAARPSDGVLGFLIATAIWFSIPSALGTSAGMAYLVMSERNGTHLLTDEEIDIGLVTPLVVEMLFGKTGALLVLTMSAMAYMSTGSGEVMSVASILVYDIYQIHINPFRPDIKEGRCKFCTKPTPSTDMRSGVERSLLCQCPHPDECVSCIKDTARFVDSPNVVRYRCPLHGDLRQYQENLLRYKSWCIVWVSLGVIPVGLLVLIANLNLNWVFLYTVMISVCTFPGVVLSVMWRRTSRNGVIWGSVVGMVVVMVVNLTLASQQPGGLANFFTSSVQIVTVFAAGGSSLFVNFFIIIVASLVDGRKTTRESRDSVWDATLKIDNPLHPWADRYINDIPGLKKGERPTVEQMEVASKTARIQAYIGSGTMVAVLILVIPITMVSFPTLDFARFRGWVYFCVFWACAMTAIAVVLAPAQEISQIVTRMRNNKHRAGTSVYDYAMSMKRVYDRKYSDIHDVTGMSYDADVDGMTDAEATRASVSADTQL